MDKILELKNHIKEILLEIESSFPDEPQLIAMKKVMDGEEDFSRKNFKAGMIKAGLKNLYELVLWGLRSGIIKDPPLHIADEIKLKGYEEYPTWLRLLNHIVASKSESEISSGDISKDSIEYYKNLIKQKYNLGKSNAKLIRFAFQVVNPIEPPKSVKGLKLPGMTVQQSLVLRLTAQGKNTKEIADILKIDPVTVDYHRSKLKKILNIVGRSNASYASMTQKALNLDPTMMADMPHLKKYPEFQPGEKIYTGLTKRQLQITKYLAQGLDIYQIAKQLKISPKTVEYHRVKLLSVLNLHSIPELTSYAMKMGLI